MVWAKPKQNDVAERGLGLFFFLFLAFRGGHAVKRRGKQNTISNKVQESNHWPNYFCISVWQIEFWTGMSSPSSHPAMFCTYTHFSCCFLAVFLSFFFVFFSKIRSTSGGIHKRHLVEGSDRRYADEMILFLPSYLKFTHERDRNCIRISSPRTSEKKIEAALAVSCFFSWFEWRPLAFFSHTRAALFTLTCPQKKYRFEVQNKVFWSEFSGLETACRADSFGINTLRVLVDIILN